MVSIFKFLEGREQITLCSPVVYRTNKILGHVPHLSNVGIAVKCMYRRRTLKSLQFDTICTVCSTPRRPVAKQRLCPTSLPHILSHVCFPHLMAAECTKCPFHFPNQSCKLRWSNKRRTYSMFPLSHGVL